MAEGLLRDMAGERFEVHSAGTEATLVRPQAIKVMKELGIDISGQESKTLERYLGEPFDYVITVCDDANEACPFFPGARRRLHWSFEDPAAAEGSEEQRLGVFRKVGTRSRDESRRNSLPEEESSEEAVGARFGGSPLGQHQLQLGDHQHGRNARRPRRTGAGWQGPRDRLLELFGRITACGGRSNARRRGAVRGRTEREQPSSPRARARRSSRMRARRNRFHTLLSAGQWPAHGEVPPRTASPHRKPPPG